jgi:hypothetical protein
LEGREKVKPIVFYDKKKQNFYLVIKKVEQLVHLRLLTKSGVLTKTKLILPVAMLKNYSEIKNCKMLQRVLFNKVAVDKIAFDGFIEFLNLEMLPVIRAGIKDGTVNESLRKVCGVTFSIFHLSRKAGETFSLDDVLYKLETKTMQTAVKKSIIQYLQERYDMWDDCELEDDLMLKEVELAKTVMAFSEKHEPIRRAARKYMMLVTQEIRESSNEDD